MDVKYKSVEHVVDRNDLNQIISYAASYGSAHGVLILPAVSATATGLKCLGQIGDVSFFQYAINLDSADMEHEETLMWSAIANLLDESD